MTSVERNPEIAALYRKYFPEDELIEGDAHEFLLRNHGDFDFVWASPPCPTHSKARMWAAKGGRYDYEYPDMTLYQEIILMQHYGKAKWVFENVDPFYEPLIRPTIKIDRHLFWSNFKISKFDVSDKISPWSVTSNTSAFGFNVAGEKIKHRKDQLIRNLVDPDIGLHILNCAMGNLRVKSTQLELL